MQAQDDTPREVRRRDLKTGTVNVQDPVTGRCPDVPGHPFDVPDSRLPLRVLDDDGELAFILLESDMRSEPVEGTQGSYVKARRRCEPCPECGHDWEKVAHQTLAGIWTAWCPLCDHEHESA